MWWLFILKATNVFPLQNFLNSGMPLTKISAAISPFEHMLYYIESKIKFVLSPL